MKPRKVSKEIFCTPPTKRKKIMIIGHRMHLGDKGLGDPFQHPARSGGGLHESRGGREAMKALQLILRLFSKGWSSQVLQKTTPISRTASAKLMRNHSTPGPSAAFNPRAAR